MPTSHWAAPRLPSAYKPRADHRGEKALYWTRRWRAAAKAYRSAHPLCIDPYRRHEEPVPSEVVDHIVPLWRAPGLRWDAGNLQALCARCHNRKTREELGGKVWGAPPPPHKRNPSAMQRDRGGGG